MKPRIAALVLSLSFASISAPARETDMERGFARPPASARPWVYWFWMDGNLSREGITADLEAMARAGIGGVIIMEVDVGVPRGPVAFMSPAWRDLFAHVAAEAARLGLEIDLNASPGWTGSGGPWIKPEQSMQTVVFREIEAEGPARFDTILPQPAAREGFYRDIAVLAFPAPAGGQRIPDIAEKALYARGHYSSERGVRSWIPVLAHPAEPSKESIIPADRIIDLTARMDEAGRLAWDIPAGRWTVMRFGRTSTGANTRPAPLPGLGLECDKLDAKALDAHFDSFIGPLMAAIGPLTGKSLASLHIDSWEMGPQNWTAAFADEFRRRRGYDLLRYLPVFSGRIVESLSISERFLFDLRATVMELILENYAGRLRDLAHRHGMRLSIEPYDGTPCDDLTLGARADVPMCEFWSDTFDTTFSCTEASSIAHTYGKKIVAAEAFTAGDGERWRLHPGSLKVLGDWAFCQGINRFVFHRYAHQPWLDRWPGMTMGPYGIHYERTQTWWDLIPAYHDYLARCQFLLQQGLWVADIAYLAPEGAPHVFRPPSSATRGHPPDRLGYNFDGCTPEALVERMSVRDGRLVLPDGMSYRLLVLPDSETMTPPLLRKIADLVRSGATIVGPRPLASPSLSGYPACDAEIERLGAELWGEEDQPARLTERSAGKGRIIPAGAGPRPKAPAQDPAKALAGSTWIWHNEGNPAAAAPVGARYFRRIFDVDAGAGIASAWIAITADNAFEAYVNGKPAGSGDNFTIAYRLDVKELIQPGRNILAVKAVNGGDAPNPASLIATLSIELRDGRTLSVRTDSAWETSLAGKDAWSRARVLGPMGMAPWGAIRPLVPAQDLYPPFEVAARILKEMGVPPDFESEANLRYAHRIAGDEDIYFVANPEDRWVNVNCTFRVAGKAPEIWDPMTGRISKAATYEEKEGRIRVPLPLGPADSIFVVFRSRGGAKADPAASPRRDEWKALPPPIAITGPWDVRFQSGRGAPEKATFDRLLDWSKHPDDGIRHFSGMATYIGSFDLAPERLGGGVRTILDLGRVEVMAKVEVNGEDLGILWKAPFRLDITRAVKAGTNRLAVTVANLWPNRLIGDQSLPPEKRIAWTTWNPFSKDSPLLASGWIGPATLQHAAAGAYAVVVSRETRDRPDWTRVIDALRTRYDAIVIPHGGDPRDALPALRDRRPHYTCFVARPDEATREFVATVHRLVRSLDDDPYADTIWGILTGFDADNALEIAGETDALVVRKVASGTEVALDCCAEGVWYCELNQGKSVRKRPGAAPVEERCEGDTTRLLAAALTDYQADLFVTSGHATERDWQIGYRYRNGRFVSEKGQLWGIDTAGARHPIVSRNPKVYMPVGNCLIGHIDGPDAMALAFLKSAGVRQMIGYTVPTWYGYAGWGCLDYFLEQPGRYTFAEAFLANHHALVHRLETKAAPGANDVKGLAYDRDVVAFYGDPAWPARMADGPRAWEQSLRIDGDLYTFEIRPNLGERTFEPVNRNGSQRGGRPIVEFLPHRIRDIEVIEGNDLRPSIADDFILVPNPGSGDPRPLYRIVFRARRADPEGAPRRGGERASLEDPFGLAIDPRGRLLVGCRGSRPRIAILSRDGEEVGSIGAGRITDPRAIAVDDRGRIIVADAARNEVVIFDAGGAFESAAGGFEAPEGVAAGPNGLIFVADTGRSRIAAIDGSSGAVAFAIDRIVAAGDSPRDIKSPSGIAIAEGLLAVSDRGNHRILVGPVPAAADVPFEPHIIDRFGMEPRSAAFGSARRLYVIDRGKILGFDASGKEVCSFRAAAVGLWYDPRGLAVDRDGSVWSVDGSTRRVLGTTADLFDEEPRVEFDTNDPTTVAIAWRTIDPAPGIVRYGPTEDCEREAADPDSSRSHRVVLKGLRPATRHYFHASDPVRAIPATTPPRSDLSLDVQRKIYAFLSRENVSGEYPFATLPEAGRTEWASLPVIVAVYGRVRFPAAADGTRPPDRVLDDGDMAVLRSEMETYRTWAWRHSSCKLNLDFHWVVVDEPREHAVLGDITQEVFADIRAGLAAQGKDPAEFWNVIIIGTHGWYALYLDGTVAGTRYELGSCYTGFGHGTQPGWWWFPVHEHGHLIHSMVMCSGAGYFAFPDAPWTLPGKFGEDFSFLAYNYRQFPRRGWLLLRTSIIRTSADANRNGVPDDDPRVPLDEKRFGWTGAMGGDCLKRLMAGVRTPGYPGDTDTDFDGKIHELNEGELYWVDRKCSKAAPVLDGRIAPGEWKEFYSMPNLATPASLRALKARLYLAWDESNHYFAIRASRRAIAGFDLDGANDGWFHGRDNLRFSVRAEGARGEEKAVAAGAIWDFLNDTIHIHDGQHWYRGAYAPGDIRAACGEDGDGGWVIECAVPARPDVRIAPAEGKRFAIRAYLWADPPDAIPQTNFFDGEDFVYDIACE